MIRRLFLSSLGLVYAIAFVSLWVQIDGLIGSRGILPAQTYLEAAATKLGGQAWWQVPTLGWLVGASDSALHALCAGGVAASLALSLGVVPAFSAAAAWVLYLSLYALGQDFLSFQWDILLLEAGFLAIWYAPLSALWWRSAAWKREPSPPITWLLRLLIAKLMFLSGVVKLSGGDASWWSLSALSYHYETTCLPTWTGWYFHQLPLWFHKLSAVGMFAVELGVSLLAFGPWRARVVAAVAFAGLMLFIGATGNYGFFNLLSIVLCLPLLDDARPGPAPRARSSWVFAAPLFVLNLIPLTRALRVPVAWPTPLTALYEVQEPFHLVNGYGLFAHMTTQRPEIVIEGSEDGREWRTFEFRWKPGDIERRPSFVQPHMPRLDWQMWFAALGSYQRNRWFVAFCQRLLEGSPNVLALLGENPFPQHPPRYLRSIVYDYKFTKLGDGSKAWWRRAEVRPYMPPVTMQADGRGLRVASELE